LTVADLQQHLSELSRFLKTAGAQSVGKELAAVAEGLTPFRQHKLTDFLRFLGQAHQYATTGILPVITGKGKGPKVKPSAAQKPLAQEVAQQVRELYDQAANPALDPTRIEVGLEPLAHLTRAGLLLVAQAVELTIPSKAKVDDIRHRIRQKIVDRRGAAQRAGMTTLPQSSVEAGR
jgi:hypothetical protein